MIQPGSKLLFIGDSVTDCGRSPAGEGLFNALGNGYVSLIDAWVTATHPTLKLRVVNKGTSGNTVRDLATRWDEDVLNQNPDWLSIMIGINDVWRQFDSPRQTEIQVSPGEYRETLDRLCSIARMDEYGEIVEATARKHNAIFVDTQAAFNELCQHMHSAQIAWDRVHPNLTGHMTLAKAFLAALDLD